MNSQLNLLIVDDDIEICHLLSQFLNKHNFIVFTAHDGEKMLMQLAQHSIDLIILDMMLPGEDGISLCRKLQTSHSNIPIIMLSAAGEDTDRIIGLEVGADDYLSKPFNPRELLARIRAILRRSHTPEIPSTTSITAGHLIQFANWALNVSTRQLISPSQVELSLSSGEYDLLMAFLEHPQQILSRDQLLDYTRSRFAGPFDRSIDMQVSRLRQKIEEDPKRPQFIKTVRGGGYLFTAAVKYT
ncbi:MAG: DNA-binding response regulator [Gammaproteobacteria bacterium RIFCSPHIGHO2_12_FULL_35_23]|nr:MAG: DNA-binding response regulator [Gammaproteobacteria bacterium RIFCSPHIGHO2_12_FULL_35_23]